MKITGYLKRFFLIPVMGLAAVMSGCSDDKADEGSFGEAIVKNVLIPSFLKVYPGQTLIIQGLGFEDSDILVFDDGDGNTYELVVTATAKSASVTIPAGITQSSYDIQVRRGVAEQALGKTLLLVTRNIDVPDEDGMTIKGAVYCGERGVEGVIVTDGVIFTKTDADGFYWLPSEKYYGYVFIVIPTGYEATTVDAIPYFWSTLTTKNLSGTEQHNFELLEVDNTDHVMLLCTDLHLANRDTTRDLEQFDTGFMPDIKRHLDTFGNRKVYSLFLGDVSWDTYWYSNAFTISEYKKKMSDFYVPIFHVIGNHDHDPLYRNNFDSEKRYKDELGPTFYAFDIGNVHYVVLDNIEYQNPITDPRSYNITITPEQLVWLQDYLTMIPDKTEPVVVAIHAQIYRRTGVGASSFTTTTTNGADLTALFSSFSNVHYVSGHTHRNYTVEVNDKLMEHNIAAVCATWWWTGALSDNEICRDGSYAGYEVFDFKGTDMSWYYKSIGFEKEKQFRAYDMNKVREYFNTNANVQKYLKLAPTNERYPVGAYPENTIVLNVFNYDSRWSIDVKENGVSIDQSQFTHKYIPDPLHVISYNVPRAIRDNAAPEGDFITYANNPHMFMVQTQSATSTLEITVTDRFGNKYTETMNRPKAFSVNME